MFPSYIPCLSSDHKLHFAFGGSSLSSVLYVFAMQVSVCPARVGFRVNLRLIQVPLQS